MTVRPDPSAKFTALCQRLRGGLIVSCQALPEEPLFGAEHMAAMARAAAYGGAAGIRANSPADIAAIRLVLAYAWNPLLAIEVAGSGHIDIVGALLLLVSAAALVRRWRATAAVALGLAIAVKFLPIVLLPLYWKRVRIRDAALATAVVGLLYVPFLNHGRIPIGSLGTYVQSYRFNGPVFAVLDQVVPPQLLAGLAVLVGLVTATLFRRSSLRSAAPEWSPDQFAWPMAASLLCAPVVYPWYLLWPLPFLMSDSTLLIILWTVSIIPTYVMWHLRTLGRPWSLPGWVMLLEYGCVAIAAAIIALRRISRSVSPQ